MNSTLSNVAHAATLPGTVNDEAPGSQGNRNNVYGHGVPSEFVPKDACLSPFRFQVRVCKVTLAVTV